MTHYHHAAISRVIAVLAMVLVVACSDGGEHPSPDSTIRRSSDLAAIDSLHAVDMRAVLAGDTATLMSIWTDDVVSLPPDKPIAVGRARNAEQLRAGMAESRDYTPLEYVLEFQTTELLGNHAVEWGTYRGKAKSKVDNSVIAYSGKVMRVLRRSPNGSWRVARTMFTQEAAPAR
jgi:ketosteroid isomerase-like protein